MGFLDDVSPFQEYSVTNLCRIFPFPSTEWNEVVSHVSIEDYKSRWWKGLPWPVLSFCEAWYYLVVLLIFLDIIYTSSPTQIVLLETLQDMPSMIEPHAYNIHLICLPDMRRPSEKHLLMKSPNLIVLSNLRQRNRATTMLQLFLLSKSRFRKRSVDDSPL